MGYPDHASFGGWSVLVTAPAGRAPPIAETWTVWTAHPDQAVRAVAQRCRARPGERVVAAEPVSVARLRGLAMTPGEVRLTPQSPPFW
jgi:hypothetical protein